MVYRLHHEIGLDVILPDSILQVNAVGKGLSDEPYAYEARIRLLIAGTQTWIASLATA